MACRLAAMTGLKPSSFVAAAVTGRLKPSAVLATSSTNVRRSIFGIEDPAISKQGIMF
jgi:hypothetical protein